VLIPNIAILGEPEAGLLALDSCGSVDPAPRSATASGMGFGDAPEGTDDAF